MYFWTVDYPVHLDYSYVLRERIGNGDGGNIDDDDDWASGGGDGITEASTIHTRPF